MEKVNSNDWKNALHLPANRPGTAPSKTSWSDEDLAHPDFAFFERYGKARVKATEKVLLLFYALNPNRTPPQGRERNIRLGTWCSALLDIPEKDLLPIAERVVRGHTSDFLPVPAALIRLWKGEETIIDDDGKSERVTRANVAAYESWEEQKARMERAAEMSLPQSLPRLEIDPEELKRRLKSPHIEVVNKNLEKQRETLSDESLLQRLFCDCGMETYRPNSPQGDSEKRAMVTRFGRWMLEHLGHEKWTPDLAREAWNEWCTLQEEFLKQELAEQSQEKTT